MVLALPIVETKHPSCEQIEARMQEIEWLADAGDWEKIELVLHGLPGLIARVPEQERRKILLDLKTHVDHISERALLQREEFAAQLRTIRTGRRAAASYEATSALAQNASHS